MAPWAEPRQIEQDLIVSRALVEIFNHDLLCAELRFRGGTALNKIIFPEPLRYSEDIDLVRTTSGPIGPLLNAMQEVLEPWLGQANYAAISVAAKLRFRMPDEDDPKAQIRMRSRFSKHENTLRKPLSRRNRRSSSWCRWDSTLSSFPRGARFFPGEHPGSEPALQSRLTGFPAFVGPVHPPCRMSRGHLQSIQVPSPWWGIVDVAVGEHEGHDGSSLRSHPMQFGVPFAIINPFPIPRLERVDP